MKDVDKLVGTTWAKAFGHSRPVGFHDSRQLFAYNLNRLKKEYTLMNFDEPGKVGSADRTCTCMFLVLILKMGLQAIHDDFSFTVSLFVFRPAPLYMYSLSPVMLPHLLLAIPGELRVKATVLLMSSALER